MNLPAAMTIEQLADRFNPTARAVWGAVKRGEVQLVRTDVDDKSPVVGLRIDHWHGGEISLKRDETTTEYAPPGTRLKVERLLL